MMLSPVVVICLRHAHFLARGRRAGNYFHVLKTKRAHVRDSDRTTAQSDMHDTLTDSCDLVAFTDVVILTVRSKLPTRVRGVEQQIRAPSGARDLDRDWGSVLLGRYMLTPRIPMCSSTCQ